MIKRGFLEYSMRWLIGQWSHHMALWNLINIDWGNDLVPSGTKPLPQPMLTYHQRSPVLFIWGQLCLNCSSYQSLKWVWKLQPSYQRMGILQKSCTKFINAYSMYGPFKSRNHQRNTWKYYRNVVPGLRKSKIASTHQIIPEAWWAGVHNYKWILVLFQQKSTGSSKPSNALSLYKQ